MAEIVEIVHELSYRVNDSGLQRVTGTLKQQFQAMQVQGAQLQRLQRLFDSTSANEVEKRQRIARMIDQTRAALQRQADATERVIQTDRRLHQALQQELGLIGSLNFRLEQLQRARIRATSQDAVRRYDQQIRQVQGQLNNISNPQGARGGLLGSIAQGFGIGGGMALFQGAVALTKELAVGSFQAAANFEQMEVAFSTLLGSRDKANQLLGDLQNFAANTPFELTQLTELSKQLLAFGFAGDEIIPNLQMLGDVAGGLGADKLPQIVYAFGQIKANGRLMGQDLMQLVNAGFNPLAVMTEKTGRSMRDLKKDMEAGKISFQDVQAAFKIATSEGGRFFNMMKAQSKTTSGAISNLGDAFDQLKIAIGQTSTGPVKVFVQGLTDIVNGWKEYISLSPAEKLREEQFELNALVTAIQSTNTNQTTRNELIAELRQKYPDFLADIDAETVATELLTRRLADVNEKYEKRIKLANSAALISNLEEENRKNLEGQSDYAIIAAALKQVGIKSDPYKGRVTFQELSRLNDEQETMLIRTLERLNFVNFMNKDIADDTRTIWEGLTRAYELYNQSVKQTPVTNAAMQSAYEQQAADKAAADPTLLAQRSLARAQNDVSQLTKAIAELKEAGRAGTISDADFYPRLSQLEHSLKAAEADVRINSANIENLKTKPQPTETSTEDDEAKDEKSIRKHGEKGFPVMATLVDVFRNDPKVESDCASIAGAIVTHVGASVKQSQSAKQLMQNAIEAGFREVSIKEALPGDLVVYRGPKYGKARYNEGGQSVGYHTEVFAGYNNGQPMLIGNPGNRDTRVTGLYGSPYKVLRSPNINIGGNDDAYKQELERAKYGIENAEELRAVLEVLRDKEREIDTAYTELLEGDAKNGIQRSADERKLREENFRKALAEIRVMRDLAANELARMEVAEKIKIATAYGKRDELDTLNKELEELEKRMNVLRQQRAEMIRIVQPLKTARDLDPVAVGDDGQVNAGRWAVSRMRERDPDEEFEKVEKDRLNTQKELEDQEKEKIENLKAAYFSLADAVSTVFNDIYDAQQRLLDKEIEVREKRVEQARELAERGNVDALRIEEERLNKAQAMRETNAQRQIQLNAILEASARAVSLAESIGAVVSAATEGDPYTAPFRIAANVAALIAGIAAVASAFSGADAFAEGIVDYQGKGGPKDDKNWVRISRGESVITAEATHRHKDILEAMNAGKLLLPTREIAMPRAVVLPEATRRDTDAVSRGEFKALGKKLDRVADAVEAIENYGVRIDRDGVAAITIGHAAKQRRRWKN